MLREDLAKDVVEVQRMSSRVMSITMILDRKVCHVVSFYAPQRGRSEEEKAEFWEYWMTALGGFLFSSSFLNNAFDTVNLLLWQNSKIFNHLYFCPQIHKHPLSLSFPTCPFKWPPVINKFSSEILMFDTVKHAAWLHASETVGFFFYSVWPEVEAVKRCMWTRVKAMAGISEEFNILIGVHQGSIRSPLRFIIVMDELTK